MSALAEALVAAQRQAVSSLTKAYVLVTLAVALVRVGRWEGAKA